MNCCIPQDVMCLQDKFYIGRLAFAVIPFLKNKIYLFIYDCWVFVAAYGFSLVVVSGG